MKRSYMVMVALMMAVLAVRNASAQEDAITLEPREFSKIGSGTGAFLSVPIGARAVALGGGYVSVSDDPTSLYWNAAGATLVPGFGASYSYGSLFAGITSNFAGAVFPIGSGYKGGVSVLSYGTDPITVTDMFNQQGTNETYTVNNIAVGLTFAGQLTDQFSFGATGKYVSLSFASVNANAIAFDLGTMYKPGVLGLQIGFAVQNLSARIHYTGSGLSHSGSRDQTSGGQEPDQQLEASDASLPLTFRAGLSSNVLEGNESNALLIATEFVSVSDAPEHLSLGAEYTWNKLISLRAGYLFGSDVYGISGGLGIKYQTGDFEGSIDYAVRPHETLGLVNMITASLRFQ